MFTITEISDTIRRQEITTYSVLLMMCNQKCTLKMQVIILSFSNEIKVRAVLNRYHTEFCQGEKVVASKTNLHKCNA